MRVDTALQAHGHVRRDACYIVYVMCVTLCVTLTDVCYIVYVMCVDVCYIVVCVDVCYIV
jgi:hypothetical protein